MSFITGLSAFSWGFWIGSVLVAIGLIGLINAESSARAFRRLRIWFAISTGKRDPGLISKRPSDYVSTRDMAKACAILTAFLVLGLFCIAFFQFDWSAAYAAGRFFNKQSGRDYGRLSASGAAPLFRRVGILAKAQRSSICLNISTA